MSRNNLRLKVACINWTLTGPPHAVAYVWDGREIIADRFFGTWREAQDWADEYARRLARAGIA